MNAAQRFLRRMVGISNEKKIQAGTVPFAPLNMWTDYGVDLDRSKMLQKFESWVYAAISKRADDISAIKLNLYKLENNGDSKEVLKHDVLDLLDRVNPFLNWTSLAKITQIYKDLTGEAYWWIVKDGTGKPIEIWPWLSPANMTPIPSAKEFIKGYRYQKPTSAEFVEFDVDEIIQHRYLNPNDPYRGLSPIGAAAWAIGTDEQAKKYNYRFFKNSALPKGILKFPGGITEEQAKQIRVQWENMHGEKNEHRLSIIGAGEYQDIGMNQRDMEFLEQRKFSRDEILAIYRVPKALLDPQDINFASALVAKEVFVNEVVVPLMRDFVDTINEFLLPHYKDGDQLYFDFDNPTVEKPAEKLVYYQTMISIGALSPNEVRQMEGFDTYEGGDQIYVPFNFMPVGSDNEEQPTKALLLGKAGKWVKRHKPNIRVKTRTLVSKQIDSVKELLKDPEFAKLIDKKEKVKAVNHKEESKQDVTDPEYQRKLIRWQEKENKVRAREQQYRKLLRKEFKRQERSVLASLHQKSIGWTFDDEGEADLFGEIFVPLHKEMLVQFGEDALRKMGLEGFRISDNVKRFLKTDGAKFIKDVNSTTKEKLAFTIAEGTDKNETLRQIADRVQNVFTEASTSRATMIARTEVVRATQFGTLEAFKQSDIVKAKEWFANPGACPICQGLAGEIAPLNENFKGGYDQPGDPHPNCSCQLLEVFKEKGLILAEISALKEQATKESGEAKSLLDAEIEKVRAISEKLNKIVDDGQGNTEPKTE